MGAEARRILESAMALSEEECAARTVELLATLYGEADAGAEQAWVEEITRRAERARAGQKAPHQWPLVSGVPRELDDRRRLVDGFPFPIVYVELDLRLGSND